MKRLALGCLCVLVAGSVAGNGNVYVSRFWHNHQPVYWPEWNGNGSQNERVQYAWDSIVLKPGQDYGSGANHPDNNLVDIFGKDDRRNAYQSGPRNALAGIDQAAGFAMSYSGSLIDNVNSLGDNGQLAYSGGWWDGNREASGWKTSGHSDAAPRLDLLGFTDHHSLGPLLPKAVFRKEIQVFKEAWWKAWNKNSDKSDHSKGFFPTEMAFSRHMIDVLADEGFEWVIVASHHLSRTCPTYFDQFDLANNNYGIFSSPPNKADLLGPPLSDGWWYAEPNPGNAAWNVSPYAYQLHKAKYVNPETGAEKRIIMVPSDDVLSYRYGYSNEGIGKIRQFISPFATDPNRPVIVMPSSDGDNAWGGGSSSWFEATPQFFNESHNAGYHRSAPQDFVNGWAWAAQDVHVEDGAWIFPESDYGSPYFLKWIEPPIRTTTATNTYPGTIVDLETPGFALKFFSWAPVIAGANWCETAEQIWTDNGGSVDAWRIQAPYDWNTDYAPNSPNTIERAWHIYLAGLDSGFNYYGGLGNDDEVKQSLATRRALEVLKPYMDANGGDDATGPTILKPQRFPYNPGAYTFGWFNSIPGGDNRYLKEMPSEFYIWTHAYDYSGIASVTLKLRLDGDGVSPGGNKALVVFVGVDTLGLDEDNLWNLGGDPQALDFLHNVAFSEPMDVAILIGDEYGDGTFSNFVFGGGYDHGQGVFYLGPGGFPAVDAAALSQFDGRTNAPTLSDDDDGDRQTERWEARIPWSALNATSPGDINRLWLGGLILSDAIASNGVDRYMSGNFLGEWAGSVGELDVYNNFGTALVTLQPLAVCLPHLDDDGDGLLNGFELQHFAHAGNAAPEGDGDSDSHTNAEEQFLGTDPTNGDSALALHDVTHAPDQNAVGWKSVGGRRYAIDYSDDLTQPGGGFAEFDAVSENDVAAGTESVESVIDDFSIRPLVGKARFYRVRCVASGP